MPKAEGGLGSLLRFPALTEYVRGTRPISARAPNRALNLTLSVPLRQSLALLMDAATPTDADLEFGQAASEIETSRYQGQPALGEGFFELSDLAPMEE